MAMNNLLKIAILTLMVMGGIFMATHNGDCNGSLYGEYSSEDAELNILMGYPSGWEYSEHRGSYGSYAQVQFYGEVKDGIAPSIVVTVEKESKVKFTPLTAQGLAEDILQKRMHFNDTEVVSRSESQLLGLPAIDLTLTYKQPVELRSLDPRMISFKERVVVVKTEDKFYTLRYVVPEEVFKDFESMFEHSLETFRIKE